MKINFEKFPCYIDIRKAAKVEMDVKFEFANQMYVHGNGIAMGALAMKIYNSQGEEEYSDNECAIIAEFAKALSPVFAESVADYLNVTRDNVP